MVIILIVFLALVSGMCASIIVSCWGKIQERRRSKQEYHSRKSRETSMEGQINDVDQMVYGTNDRLNNLNGNKKQLQRAATTEIQQQQHHQTGSKFFLNENSFDGSQRYLAATGSGDAYLAGLQYQQHPLVNQMLSVDGNYGGMYSTDSNHPMLTSETSLDIKPDLDALREASNQDKQLVTHHVFGSRQKVHDIYTPEHHNQQLNKSLQNVQQSILANMAQQQQAGQQMLKQKSVPDSNNYQFRIHSGLVSNDENNQQQLIPPSNSNGTLANHDAQQQMLNIAQANINNQQQKLNSSIFQQQNLPDNNNNNNINNKNLIAASNKGGPYGRYLRQQQDINSIPGGAGNSGTINLGHLLNHSASAQTMPISLAKYNNLLQSAQLSTAGGQSLVQPEVGQKLNYDTRIGSRFATNTAYNPQRALTMSTKHQPQFHDQQQQQNLQSTNIYGINYPQAQSLAASHLSSSVTCCNLLNADDCANETPLINDLIAQAAINQQQQQQQDHQYRLQRQHQNDQSYELKSRTLGPRMPGANAIPRSISAHQLSKAQLRQSQQLQQPTQTVQQQIQLQQKQQLHHQLQHLQHQQQPHQLSYKSMSDAGHVIRHQPPNHAFSYPHACTGPHLDPSGCSPKVTGAGGQQSPALPPPPPPPNLARGPATCSRILVGPLPAPPQSGGGGQQMDTRRAAFKVSRLDQSQLTGDTLQDSDLIMANLPKGTSLQFDEPSTESDATFGMLMNSIGNTPLNLGARANLALQNPINLGAQSQQPLGLPHLNQQQQQFYIAQQGIAGKQQAGGQPQQMVLTHLGDCNFVRHQRGNQLMSRQHDLLANPLVCDCGALERATQMRQQQQQQHLQQANSSHEFDDSTDDAPYLLQSAVRGGGSMEQASLSNNNNNLMLATQRGVVGLNIGNRGKNQLHSNLNSTNNSIYGQQQQFQQQQRYARFRQQSSELTGDDDEYDDDDDINDYNVGQEEDEESSDGVILNPCALAQPITATVSVGASVDSYRVPHSVIRNKQTLRDAPLGGGGKQLSGSRTSIGCQSCTCGSQLQLDQVGASEDEQSSTTEQSNSARSGGDQNKNTGLSKAMKATSLNHDNKEMASTSLPLDDNDQKNLTRGEKVCGVTSSEDVESTIIFDGNNEVGTRLNKKAIDNCDIKLTSEGKNAQVANST